MSEIVLSVENLYKQYRLGLVGSGTLKDDLARWWARVRGKEDPLLKIGESNQLDTIDGDYVWALQDINFDVKQGEVLGIIGKNGAGKSTLLKILSKVTGPTKGNIKVKGRVASLLEVGTGFHPELTGRENIFLNGAILGMNKREIRSKLDEITDFAGVSKYVDTPVKRYSSGMYVRLAFAVAAHLDPEILIVDEVLAVGDADFQKKAIGKMKDVSKGEGRTVLFVSHNMASVKALCTQAIMLKQGQVVYEGEPNNVIEEYLSQDRIDIKNGLIPENASTYHTGEAKFRRVSLTNVEGVTTNAFYYKSPLHFNLDLDVLQPIEDVVLDIKISTKDGMIILDASTTYEQKELLSFDKGLKKVSCKMENNLQPGNYNTTLGIHYVNGNTIDYVEHVCEFSVLNFLEGEDAHFKQRFYHGFVAAKSRWSVSN
ncbi:ABC transporter ATP-binding protein [Microscilla marina]|uniref:ABC transporter, ATP-binding protein n=1 Tax=Microscilla marina ATCC 23134 TaxID=313606 RepID=A1ZCI3_MICM2|nr:ABC transporter ATP-binding protein [Microscilla marina]EAY31985.1 ABC transporter, ATP-binding protein [Microscilla marina ATCC 23134]